MKSRSVSNLQDTLASFDTNFLPVPPDVAAEFRSNAFHAEQAPPVILAELPPLSSEGTSADTGPSAASASPFALLDTQSETGHASPESSATAIADISHGSGSINAVGAAETNSGLHIAAPTDSDFSAATEALFASTASASPVSINLASLTPLVGQGAAIALTQSASIQLDTHSDSSAPTAIASGLAFLENSPGSPITSNSFSGGANASQVRAALNESGLSVNGSGIKVGVLSDSFNNLGGAAADEASGALPSTVQVLKDIASGGTDEGRAMMQVIHDIAPGASLAFYTADASEQDFANGILALAAAGCKVICDDITYFDEPFFQNGIVAQAIETVEAQGVTFVTSAGNDASNAYQAAWTPGSGTFDGFSFTDAQLFNGSIAQTISVTASASDPVPLLLEWNKAYGQANFNSGTAPDIDMFIFHNGSLVAQATNASVGEANNPFTGYQFTSSGTYQVVIQNNFGPDPGLIKEIIVGDGRPETISGANAGTVFGHHMTPGAITAGAVSAANTPAFGFSPTSESFSSSGVGTELLFADNGTPLSSPQLLNPVDVSSVDGIATTVPGGLSDFFGTSAASASLAGVAAMILSADPNLTPAQVEQIMVQTALPMSNPAVSGAGLVQVNAAVAAALAMITTVVEAHGVTSLVQVGSDYFLNPVAGGTGPELKYLGSPVTVGEWAGWTLVAGEQTSSGYDVAFFNASSGLFNIWTTDNNGNYNGGIGGLSGTSSALENFETAFQQDLNHDGTIGPPPAPPPPTGTVVDNHGATWLIQSGSDYFLNPVASGTTITGPELMYNGTPVTVGEWAGWALVGAEKTSSGYDVAFFNASTGLFNIWTTDNNGNYNGGVGGLSGTSSALENFEVAFQQDLNNDGTIGPPTAPPPPTGTVVDNHGATWLIQSGSDYFLNPATSGTNITGPELLYNGTPVTVGEWAGWTLVGAEQTSSGYDVAFFNASTGLFNIWTTDNNGNYNGGIGGLSATSATLESYEIIFQQDLNNDGTVGPLPPPPPTTIEAHGVTALLQSGSDYFLNPVASGNTITGPELMYSGAPVTVGEWAGWTVIAAEKTSSGYDVAFFNASTGLFNIWTTDNNGNYNGGIGGLSGSSSTLQNFETIFNQDLNGNGTIGSSANGQIASNSTPDNFQFASHTSGSPQGTVHFPHPDGAAGQGEAAAGTTGVMTGHDSFAFQDLAPANSSTAPATDLWHSAFVTNTHAASAGVHEVSFNNTTAHDAAHGVQWLAHHGDFHLI